MNNGSSGSFWVKHGGHVITALAALLAFTAGLLGAGIGADASVRVADKQIQAENDRRAQEQRRVAYNAYLDAANEYFFSWDRFVKAPEGSARNAAAGRFITARFAYRGQVNDVFVFGSASAWDAVKGMDATLPQFLGSSDLPRLDGTPDEAAFAAAYRAFLVVQCREVAAISRSECAI